MTYIVKDSFGTLTISDKITIVQKGIFNAYYKALSKSEISLLKQGINIKIPVLRSSKIRITCHL